MDLYQLQKESWRTAEDHGFHEGVQDVNPAIKLALIHSEISEAYEEYLNGSPMAYFSEGGKSEGISAESADIAIRVGDLFEILGGNLKDEVEKSAADNPSVWPVLRTNIEGKFNLLHVQTSRALEAYRKGKTEDILSALALLIRQIYSLSDWPFDFNLDRSIEIKAAYNKTRPYKHGGKKV